MTETDIEIVFRVNFGSGDNHEAHRPTSIGGGGGSNRVLPEWLIQIVQSCHAAPPGRINNNELLQCLFFDGRRVVPDERLLCYPIGDVSQAD